MSGRRTEHRDDMSDRLEGGDLEEAAFDAFAIDEQMAGEAPVVRVALHPHQLELAQPNRTLVRRTQPEGRAPRRLPQRARASSVVFSSSALLTWQTIHHLNCGDF